MPGSTWSPSITAHVDRTGCCRYTTAQFQRYVDRFGDGLVIYWFDFIDTLNDVPGADGRPAACRGGGSAQRLSRMRSESQ